MTETDEGFDRLVGQNLQQLRVAAGMSQAELADQLTGRGHPMRQQIVAKIEAGQRPLRFREAALFADALEVDVDLLLAEYPVFDAARMLIEGTRRVQDAVEQLSLSTKKLLLTQSLLWHEVQRAIERGTEDTLINEAVTALQFEPVAIFEGAKIHRDAEYREQEAFLASSVEYVGTDEREDVLTALEERFGPRG